jgi:tol-pal system protein YbgF
MSDNNLALAPKTEETINGDDINKKKILPGSSEPQSLGQLSYKDMTTSDQTQIIESVEQTEEIIAEVFNSEEKILPDVTPKEQYQFARNFLKVGDYDNAEKAFREFVLINPDNELSGNAQYWYAETYRIRQMYTDAATAYLEGYQKYPKSKIAPENLLKLGVSLVQMGEKDQGCLMIAGVRKQYPNATQSVLQKAKYYEEKEFECKKENS